jgi:nucleotide-binding universal stress UspA family protein
MSKKPVRKRILVAIDESDNSPSVMSAAAEIAENVDADVTVITVIDMPKMVASEGEFSKAQIESEEKRVAEYQKLLIDKYFSGSTQLVESKILHGDAVEKICEFAERLNAHMVVIGTRGLGKIQSKLLGSVSEKVLKNCHCSVLVVRK